MRKPDLARWGRAVRFKPGVYAAAAAFLVGGFAVTDPALHAVAYASYVIAFGLVLWGTTIHGRHLWEPWWNGPRFPFKIDVWTPDFDYDVGSNVAGIKWEKGYARIRVTLANAVDVPIEEIAATFVPDRPIAQSRVHSDFATCRIGLIDRQYEVTLIVRKPDGSEAALPTNRDDSLHLGPPHVLFCDRLPGGVSIEVNLATVVPNAPNAHRMWNPQRTDPEHMDLELRWTFDGHRAVKRNRYTFKRERT